MTPATLSGRRCTPDQRARDDITARLDATLFVEAGAGSGKTRALVDRIVRLVTSGTAGLTTWPPSPSPRRPRPSCATACATGWSDERDRALVEGDGERVARCRAALDDLDGAAIGTLHGFARRILTEHPIEAGCRRGSRCSTRSARRWRSTTGGPGSSTGCWPTRPVERPLLLAGGRRPARPPAAHRPRLQRQLGPGPGPRPRRGGRPRLDRDCDDLLAEIARRGGRLRPLLRRRAQAARPAGRARGLGRPGGGRQRRVHPPARSWPQGRAGPGPGRKPNWPGYDLAA